MSALRSRDETPGPGQRLKLSEPMDDAASYVGIAAFFRDTVDAEWSMLVPKSQWKKADPAKLVATANRMEIAQ